jgi:hypothetical protein
MSQNPYARAVTRIRPVVIPDRRHRIDRIVERETKKGSP